MVRRIADRIQTNLRLFFSFYPLRFRNGDLGRYAMIGLVYWRVRTLNSWRDRHQTCVCQWATFSVRSQCVDPFTEYFSSYRAFQRTCERKNNGQDIRSPLLFFVLFMISARRPSAEWNSPESPLNVEYIFYCVPMNSVHSIHLRVHKHNAQCATESVWTFKL